MKTPLELLQVELDALKRVHIKILHELGETKSNLKKAYEKLESYEHGSK